VLTQVPGSAGTARPASIVGRSQQRFAQENQRLPHSAEQSMHDSQEEAEHALSQEALVALQASSQEKSRAGPRPTFDMHSSRMALTSLKSRSFAGAKQTSACESKHANICPTSCWLQERVQ